MKDYTDQFSFVLKPATIPEAGIGVFATHDIKAGTKLALNKEGGDSRIAEPGTIPTAFKHFCITLPHGKLKVPNEFNHLWIVWYLNHSDIPNIHLKMPENNYYALRDIHAGEELFTNYNSFNEPEEAKEAYYKK